MKVLVTGCCGFIGYHVSKKLLSMGNFVVGVDNINPYYDVSLKEYRLDLLRRDEKFKFYKIDISDLGKISNVFEENNFGYVCHLAAQAGVRYSIENPFVYQKTNLEGFQNIIELSKRKQVVNFVYASSSSVYGANTKTPFSEKDPVELPISLYAATKRSNELTAYTYSHLFNLNCIGLRYFTVYGPYGRPDMALFIFTKAISEGKSIDVYNYGNMSRSFTYISDVVDATITALHNPMRYELINIGGNDAVGLLPYIKYIEEALGKKAIKNLRPMQPGDVISTIADVSKSKELLGYVPKVDVCNGVQRFVKWYIDYYGG